MHLYKKIFEKNCVCVYKYSGETSKDLQFSSILDEIILSNQYSYIVTIRNSIVCYSRRESDFWENETEKQLCLFFKNLIKRFKLQYEMENDILMRDIKEYNIEDRSNRAKFLSELKYKHEMFLQREKTINEYYRKIGEFQEGLNRLGFDCRNGEIL